MFRYFIFRQGAVEAIACIVDELKYDIIPYVVLLVVPLLGRMSDQNMCVRLMGTHSFATLIQLMPLDGGIPEPPALKGKTNIFFVYYIIFKFFITYDILICE